MLDTIITPNNIFKLMKGLKKLLGQLLQPYKMEGNSQELNDEIRLHVAGAGVRHGSEFRDLISHKNNCKLDQDFMDKWVEPFYMKIGSTDEEWIKQLQDIEPEISKDLILKLLGDFNWRSRSTGTFFAGLKGFHDAAEIIGTHLLKSELTYAGKTYALALASFNTEKATEYLEKYLDYYLLKPDLYFDQREVLAALIYLDKINETQRASKHSKNWLKFVENKPYWNKDVDISQLENQLNLLKRI